LIVEGFDFSYHPPRNLDLLIQVGYFFSQGSGGKCEGAAGAHCVGKGYIRIGVGGASGCHSGNDGIRMRGDRVRGDIFGRGAVGQKMSPDELAFSWYSVRSASC